MANFPKLLRISRSTQQGKKWMAVFEDGTVTHFGSSQHTDFTIGATMKQRKSYRLRHAGDNINNPTTAGALSYHILWGESQDMDKNVATFKRRFCV